MWNGAEIVAETLFNTWLEFSIFFLHILLRCCCCCWVVWLNKIYIWTYSFNVHSRLSSMIPPFKRSTFAFVCGAFFITYQHYYFAFVPIYYDSLCCYYFDVIYYIVVAVVRCSLAHYFYYYQSIYYDPIQFEIGFYRFFSTLIFHLSTFIRIHYPFHSFDFYYQYIFVCVGVKNQCLTKYTWKWKYFSQL